MNANSVIVCKPVKEATDPLLEQVEKTYVDSFPEDERRDFRLIRQLIEKKPCFAAYVLLQDDVYVGFITAWTFDTFTYVEHFAIDEAARNGGIGGVAMKQFLSICETPVVLEVEMPADEMSKRRIGFYERLGFVLDENIYHQPPYRDGNSWLEMRLMTYGALDMTQAFDRVRDIIYTQVYDVLCFERVK